MYEKACAIVTALFFALFMALSVLVVSVFSIPALLLCGGCLVLMALGRPVLPERSCLGALWFLTLFLWPLPYAMCGPENVRAVLLLRLFLGVFAASAAYTLLYVLAAKQGRERTSATGESPYFSNRLLTRQDALAGLVAFFVGGMACSALFALAEHAAPCEFSGCIW